MNVDNAREELGRLYERTLLDKQYLVDGLNSLLLPSNARIIDVGCGSGGSTQIIRECYPGAEIYGVDNSIRTLRYASMLLKNEKVKFVYADAMHMPFSDSYFDCCIAKMLFDIVSNPEEILKEMIRLLKPQKTLLIYGNTRSTAQGSSHLKSADKLIEAYKRYVRLSGWKGFDIEYIRGILTEKYRMTVRVQKIIKDTANPGRESLAKYYVLPEEEIKRSAENNVLAKLGLVSVRDVIEYETSLKELLMSSDEYLSFEQTILYATKEKVQ